MYGTPAGLGGLGHRISSVSPIAGYPMSDTPPASSWRVRVGMGNRRIDAQNLVVSGWTRAEIRTLWISGRRIRLERLEYAASIGFRTIARGVTFQLLRSCSVHTLAPALCNWFFDAPDKTATNCSWQPLGKIRQWGAIPSDSPLPQNQPTLFTRQRSRSFHRPSSKYIDRQRMRKHSGWRKLLGWDIERRSSI